MAAEENKIPLLGRIWWLTTVALPSGFVEDTAFDDRFGQGGASGYTGPANGGTSTHTHTGIASHTHTGDSHVHNTQATTSNTTTATNCGTSAGSLVPSELAHRHVAKDSPAATITYVANTATITSTAAQQPPYHRVKFLKPDGAVADIPADACALFDSTSGLPTGWQLSDGTDSTRPDLDGKFLFGATAGDTIGNTGGSATHTHAVTNHSHAINDHSHAQGAMGAADTAILGNGAFGQAFLRGVNHHLMTLLNKALSDMTAAPTVTVTGSGSSEPAFNEVAPIVNKNAGADTPIGIIIGFVGDVATDIPDNWALCDGSGLTPNWLDKQIRCKKSGSLGSGGSNSHAHTYTHSHNHSAAHNHASSVVFTGDIVVPGGFGDTGLDSAVDAHSHDNFQVDTTTPTIQGASPTTGTDSIRYLFRTIVFIRKTSAAGPAVQATPAGDVVLIPPSPQSDPVDFNLVPRMIFRPVLVDPRVLDDEDQGIVISVDHQSPRFENLGFFESTPNDPVSVPKDATTDVTITLTMREDMRDHSTGWILLLNDLTIHGDLFRNDTLTCGFGQRVESTVISKADWNSFVGSARIVDVRFINPARPDADNPCLEAFIQWRVAFDYIGVDPALASGHYHSFASEDPTFFAANGTLDQTGVEATSFGELVFDPVSASLVFVHKQFGIETRGGWTVVDGAVAFIATGQIKGQTILHSSGGGCTLV